MYEINALYVGVYGSEEDITAFMENCKQHELRKCFADGPFPDTTKDDSSYYKLETVSKHYGRDYDFSFQYSPKKTEGLIVFACQLNFLAIDEELGLWEDIAKDHPNLTIQADLLWDMEETRGQTIWADGRLISENLYDECMPNCSHCIHGQAGYSENTPPSSSEV